MAITFLNPLLRERCLTIAELPAYCGQRFFTAFCKRQWCKEEFFSAWEISWNKGTSINISSTAHMKKSLQGRFRIFFLDFLKTVHEKCNSQMNTISTFFPKIRALLLNFQKRAGETSTPPPASYYLLVVICSPGSLTKKFSDIQKQPSGSILKKRCSENMPQTYRRTRMPKCDFNKVVHLKLHYGMGVVLYICVIFSEHLFIINHLWRAASIHNIPRYFCEISVCDDSQLFTINLILGNMVHVGCQIHIIFLRILNIVEFSQCR